jgi:SH3 domain
MVRESTDQAGFFPHAYVRVLNGADQAAPKVERNGPEQHVRVLFDYESRSQSEISLKKDDELTLLTDDDPDWWSGKNIKTGKSGFFPAGYVKVVVDGEEAADTGKSETNPFVEADGASKHSSSGEASPSSDSSAADTPIVPVTPAPVAVDESKMAEMMKDHDDAIERLQQEAKEAADDLRAKFVGAGETARKLVEANQARASVERVKDAVREAIQQGVCCFSCFVGVWWVFCVRVPVLMPICQNGQLWRKQRGQLRSPRPASSNR